MDTGIQARAFARAENVLKRLVSNRQMTLQGEEWLINALDPFHDRELKNLAGWPDVETGYSVVQKVKQTISLASPGGAGFPANWDLWVVALPVLDNRFCSMTTQRENNTFVWPNTAAFQWGGVHAYAVAPGTDFNPTLATTVHIGVVEANVPYTTGVGRLIAIAHETVNTTAPLQKQGSVTVFRQMQQGRNNQGVNGLVQGSVYPAGQLRGTATLFRRPPGSLATIMLMPGSRTWDAAEGTYVVSSFHSNENPPMVPDYNMTFWSTTDDIEEDNNISDWIIPQMHANAVSLGFPAGTVSPLAIKAYPIHTSGTIFSGLSAQSTIQLNVNMVFERFVDQNEADLLVLATPSAEFDPVALEIYSHALSQMPPGVCFKDNPMGEWFMDVVQQVSDFLSFIPHPIAQKISAGGQAIAGPYFKKYPRQTEAVIVQAQPARKKTRKAKRNNAFLASGSRTTPSGKKIQGPMTKDINEMRAVRRRARIARKMRDM